MERTCKRRQVWQQIFWRMSFYTHYRQCFVVLYRNLLQEIPLINLPSGYYIDTISRATISEFTWVMPWKRRLFSRLIEQECRGFIVRNKSCVPVSYSWIGFSQVMLDSCYLWKLDDTEACLFGSCVNYNYRNCGIHSAMLAYRLGIIKEAGRKQGVVLIDQDNERGIKALERIGFYKHRVICVERLWGTTKVIQCI